MVLQSIAVNAFTKVHRLVVLSADLWVCIVELGGPVGRTVLSEDLVVLEAGLGGPGIWVGWS